MYSIFSTYALALTDPDKLIEAFGLIGLGVIVFAESGLLIGFFLPGDSLLIAAGLLAAGGEFAIWKVCAICFVAAITGDQVGYTFGARVGPALFKRPDSRFIKQAYIAHGKVFFETRGARTVVIARFVPIMRTFVPIVAGALAMPRPKFIAYNIFGGVIWAIGLPLVGWGLGKKFPDIETYLLPIGIVAAIFSIWQGWREIKKLGRPPTSAEVTKEASTAHQTAT